MLLSDSFEFISSARPNRPFYSCVLSQYLAMNASEAGGDLALIQTSQLFSCKYQVVSIRTRGGGGVLDISLGGEVRHGPSYPDPVKTNIADFPTLFKTEFRFFNTLFKTFNPNIN